MVIHDFELAALKDDAATSGSASRHHVYGTWNYMSPEYLEGGSEPSIDVYSFAMSAWQMYTGCVPYSKIGWRMLRQHIKTTRPDKPASMSDVLWSHVQRWWDPDPSLRPTFVEIELTLQKFVETGQWVII